LRDKPIRLIKWWKAGLKNLLVSPCFKRRIRRRAIRDYQIGELQNSPYPFNVVPTYLRSKALLEVNDYGGQRPGSNLQISVIIHNCPKFFRILGPFLFGWSGPILSLLISRSFLNHA
jgi:hypothetical protein